MRHVDIPISTPSSLISSLARRIVCYQIPCVRTGGMRCHTTDSLAQNLRAVYDKNGKKMVSSEGGSNIEDPAGFFANVFGGERFMDYVRSVPRNTSLTFLF